MHKQRLIGIGIAGALALSAATASAYDAQYYGNDPLLDIGATAHPAIATYIEEGNDGADLYLGDYATATLVGTTDGALDLHIGDSDAMEFGATISAAYDEDLLDGGTASSTDIGTIAQYPVEGHGGVTDGLLYGETRVTYLSGDGNEAVLPINGDELFNKTIAMSTDGNALPVPANNGQMIEATHIVAGMTAKPICGPTSGAANMDETALTLQNVV